MFPGIGAALIINCYAVPHYNRFRNRLVAYISEQELSRNGMLDGETGGLYLRYFVLRSYQEFCDSELNALGDKARTALIAGFIASVVAIVLAVFAYSTSGSWSSTINCYAL